MSEKIVQQDGVVVISTCEDISHTEIIRRIFKVESLPQPIDEENCSSYVWKCDTKYYTADVHLYACKEKLKFTSNFLEKIKATIVCFDSKQIDSFEEALSWLPLFKDVEADIKLLLCQDSTDFDNDEKRDSIMKWCVENQYELIDLNPATESDDEDEAPSNFKDAVGYDRVIQALESNTWDSMKLKVCSKTESSEAACSSSSQESKSKKNPKEKKAKKVIVRDEECTLEEKWLDKVAKGEDSDGECFESLFSKFASMKDKAEGLKGEDRRKYAEEVAVAFWRAMGGDEDEIEGLDDD